MTINERRAVFGSWFKEQRKLSGKTQDEVAALTGLHKVTISKIEHGQEVSEETAAILCEAVGAPKEEGVLRSLKVSLPIMDASNEREREVVRILRGVPPYKQDDFVDTIRSLAGLAA